MSSFIQQDIRDGVLTITLCRQDKKNALTAAMYAELASAIGEASPGDNVRCIVITGGTDFTAGNDLADFLENPPTSPDAPVVQFMQALESCPLPVVAAVDGVAVGIGTTLLLHCDLIYCTPGTRFAMPFINLGVVPEFASSLLLPRLAGYPRAAELLMLGEPFGADKAQEIGLVNAIVEAEQLQEYVQHVARKLAEKPQTALHHTKALLKGNSVSVQERINAEMEVFAKLLTSEDAVNRLKGFFRKK